MSFRDDEADFLREMPVPFVLVKVKENEAGEAIDLVYSSVNDAAANLEGLTNDKLAGTSFFEVHPEASRNLLAILGETAKTGKKQYFTWCHAIKNRYYSICTYRPRAGYCACVLEDVTEEAHREAAVKKERQLLELQATRDPLTELLHVRQGRHLVERALCEPRWPGVRGALFMFDVDDFKRVNDKFGHHRGDAVLKGFARVLERAFRCSDIVFRAGGDEFSAFVSDLPGPCVIERICADVIKGIEALSKDGITVSVSIGVAYGLLDARSSDDFYRGADEALYRIKRTGKSSYRIEDMDGVERDRRAS